MTTTSLPRPSSRPSPSPISQLLTTSTPDQARSPLALPLEILHNLRHQHSWTDLTLHYIPPTSSSTRTLHSLSLPLSSFAPSLTDTSTARTTAILISGQPPRPVYIHPDEQTAALKAKSNTVKDNSSGDGTDNISAAANPTTTTITPPPPPREYVLPLSLAVTPSIAFLSGVFDALPLPAPSASSTSSSSVADSSASEVPALSLPARDQEQDQQDRPDKATSSSTNTNAKRLLLAIKGPDGTIAYYVCLEGEVKPRQNG